MTKLLAVKFGEDQLCGALNYPATDILTILRNVIDLTNREKSVRIEDNCTELCRSMAPGLSQTQLKFQTLRREISVARINIGRLLKSFDPIKYELNGYGRRPVELVLDEILTVQLANKDYNKNQIAV